MVMDSDNYRDWPGITLEEFEKVYDMECNSKSPYRTDLLAWLQQHHPVLHYKFLYKRGMVTYDRPLDGGAWREKLKDLYISPESLPSIDASTWLSDCLHSLRLVDMKCVVWVDSLGEFSLEEYPLGTATD